MWTVSLHLLLTILMLYFLNIHLHVTGFHVFVHFVDKLWTHIHDKNIGIIVCGFCGTCGNFEQIVWVFAWGLCHAVTRPLPCSVIDIGTMSVPCGSEVFATREWFTLAQGLCCTSLIDFRASIIIWARGLFHASTRSLLWSVVDNGMRSLPCGHEAFAVHVIIWARGLCRAGRGIYFENVIICGMRSLPCRHMVSTVRVWLSLARGLYHASTKSLLCECDWCWHEEFVVWVWLIKVFSIWVIDIVVWGGSIYVRF